MTYYTLPTTAGNAELASAQAANEGVPFTHIALGDGNGAAVVPSAAQTALVHEVHRAEITSITQDQDNPTWLIFEAVVPEEVGGWTIRECALIGGRVPGIFMAVGNYPETYKPTLAEGSARALVVRMIVAYADTAAVDLSINPAVFSTAQDVLNQVAIHEAKVNPHPQYATLVQLAAAIADLVNSSPAALDTLKELATALGDDANFATTITNALALKAPLASPELTGTPKAPTAPNGTNTTQLATTAFVQAAFAGLVVQYVQASADVNKGVYLTNTSAGPITLTLPLTPNVGDSLQFIDVTGTWGANNLTIDRNGKTIMGLAENLVCNINGENFIIWFNGTTWRIA